MNIQNYPKYSISDMCQMFDQLIDKMKNSEKRLDRLEYKLSDWVIGGNTVNDEEVDIILKVKADRKKMKQVKRIV